MSLSFTIFARMITMLAGVGSLLTAPAAAADLFTPDLVGPAATVDQGRFGYFSDNLAKWNVVLGAGAMIAPKFEGSKEYKVSPVPFVSASFGDRVVVDPRGLTVNIYKTHGFSFGVRGGYDLGRKEDDSDHLQGLGDIDAGGVVGGTIAYELGAFEIYSSLEKIIGGSDGMEAKLGMDVFQRLDRFVFRSGVSATWADSKYMETYFGVAPEQSANSGLAVYQAGAGFKRVDLEASVTYMASENWMVRGQAAVGYLLGDAADSPIVQDKLQPSAMLMVGYRF
ncbi:MipA/OmpV family protein [Kaistia terrae]|uniref:MipA/OmpV family protein n=1 Tax=Kaistia terrae TaxID=537017 RepID=A0ABW0Q4E7_9HYPH|nr:MipA/OmpV family protein [Kaistia terrae]MCX5581683.1 MipA/OmpV family protein [Kaistia terrae]